MAVDENGNEIINNEPSESEKRIKDLSGKVRATAEERDTERTAREAAEAKALESDKKAQFAESFSDIVATNPAAKDHKEDIRAKVMSGYTVEDATFAVLGKAGKLGHAQGDSQAIAGGSAVITPPQNGTQKSVSEMTRDEKRAALMEAEGRGDLALT